jgi:hypothetical protein
MCVTCAFPDRVLKGYVCSALLGVGLGRFRRAAARCAPQPMVRARKTAASPSNDPSLGVASDADPPRAQVHLPAPPRTSSRPISTMEEAADRPVSADEGAPPDEPVYSVMFISLVAQRCTDHPTNAPQSTSSSSNVQGHRPFPPTTSNVRFSSLWRGGSRVAGPGGDAGESPRFEPAATVAAITTNPTPS